MKERQLDPMVYAMERLHIRAPRLLFLNESHYHLLGMH